MKRALMLCCSLALVLGLADMARAGNISVSLVSPGSVTSHDGSVYVGPYQLLVNGTNLSAVCDDYGDEISTGENWTANEVPFTQAGVSAALFGGAQNADQLYLEAAYLTSLFNQEPTSDYNDIHFALWGLFNPSALQSSNYDAGAAGFLSLAESQSLSFSEFQNWEILVPASGPNRAQEFLVPGGPAATPEPASLLLFGAGILGISFLVRRRLPARVNA
jgi:hypothetical protein